MSEEPAESRLKSLPSWAGLVFGLLGAVTGTIGFVQSWQDRQKLIEIESNRVLDQAWDLLGGEQGTASISSRILSNAARRSDIEKARRLVRDAERIYPSNDFIHIVRSQICLAEQNLGCALEEAEKAAAIDPENTASLSAKAGMLMLNDKPEQAVPIIERVIELEALEGETISNSFQILGEAKRQLGEFQEAETALWKALSIEPTDIEALNSMGLTLIGAGRSEEAKRWFERQVELYPLEASSLYSLGEFYRRTGAWEDAISTYRQAIDLHDDDHDYEFRYAIAYALYEQSDIDGAIAVQRENAALYPTAESLRALSWLHFFNGDRHAALDALDRSASIEPDHSDNTILRDLLGNTDEIGGDITPFSETPFEPIGSPQ